MSRNRRVWKWKWFSVAYEPSFWCVAVGVEFDPQWDRGIGIGIGPFTFSFQVKS